jgi:oxygen-independent coproporphyrinogen-3 oxidase
MPPFGDALLREIKLWAPVANDRPVETVFFGGGTPSLLPVSDNERILAAIQESYNLACDAEVSIEANPGTVDQEYLRALADTGFNRISFGVQSFHDADLKFLDRIHCAQDAIDSVQWAREAGFSRISLDLIYGLPDQTLNAWSSNLDQALVLDPGHLSLYALTIEEGTRLAYDIDHGRIPEPDADLQADMYELTSRRLASAGYMQYEISNWSRSGQQCRHNLVYWRNTEWLGFGPGAHSHWGGHRFANVYSPRRYIDLINGAEGSTPAGGSSRDLLDSMPHLTLVETQSDDLQLADTAILALRLNEGLDLTAFEQRLGHSFEEVYGEPYREMTAAGLLERSNGNVRLTDHGRFLANEVFVRLLPD